MKEHNDMTSTSFTKTAKSNDRAYRWLGDLDHDFYQDERHKAVWFEAFAVGYQGLLLGIFGLTGLMLWIGGASAFPYAGPFVILMILCGGMVQNAVTRQSVEYFPRKTDFANARGRVALLLGLFALTGAMRAMLDLGSRDGFFGGFGTSGAIGLALGVVVAVVMANREQRQHERQEELDALTEK